MKLGDSLLPCTSIDGLTKLMTQNMTELEQGILLSPVISKHTKSEGYT